MFLWAAASNWRNQDVLMGDVVITGQANEAGEITGIPEDLLHLITGVPSTSTKSKRSAARHGPETA